MAGAMPLGIATRRFIPRMPDLVDADVDDILRMVNPNSLLGQSPAAVQEESGVSSPTRQRKMPRRKRTRR